MPTHLPFLLTAFSTVPGAMTVMDILQVPGKEARFVGGCVRDALVHKPLQDIDIATPLSPMEVTRLLEDQQIRVKPTGIEHGTVMAIIEQHGFEITTLRRDVDCDGRHAVVSFTDNWEEDAARR